MSTIFGKLHENASGQQHMAAAWTAGSQIDAIYQNSDNLGKGLIDHMLICATGYSHPSLLSQAIDADSYIAAFVDAMESDDACYEDEDERMQHYVDSGDYPQSAIDAVNQVTCLLGGYTIGPFEKTVEAA